MPVALQSRVKTELKRLIAERHVQKLRSCTDDQLISPIVITVKRAGSLKLAMDSKMLNTMVSKNKYQMPNIDELIDKIGQIITSKRPGQVWFTVLDLKYAYGQLSLSPETAAQCNFSIVGGAATGTYRFLTGFYGLSDMPAEFQQTIDKTFRDAQGACAFIYDIIVCTKGSAAEHMRDVNRVLHRLNAANLALKISKCDFLLSEVDWLGFRLSQTGIKPLKHKLDGL